MVGARVSRPDLSGCPGEGTAAQVAIATMFHVEHSGAPRFGQCSTWNVQRAGTAADSHSSM